MASNQHTGNNPLNIPRIDATREGINSAFALVSKEVAKRTPRESMGAGSQHMASGVFTIPRIAVESAGSRHAFHAVMWTEGGDIKANFKEAFVIDGDDITPVFAAAADQTRTVAIGDIYYVEIEDEGDGVESVDFVEEADKPDLPTNTYIKVVEFEAGDLAGTIKPIYYRYNSIVYKEETEVIPYLFYFANDTILQVEDETILAGYDPNRVADPAANPPIPGPDNDWSIEFAISGTGEMTGDVVYNNEVLRFDDDPQTVYRLPVIRDKRRVGTGGCYQEDSSCNNGSPAIQVIKIG